MKPEDIIQIIVVSIALILAFLFVVMPILSGESAAKEKAEKDITLIKSKINSDQVLIDFLNSPLKECDAVKNPQYYPDLEVEDLLINLDVETMNYADLISFVISGNPAEQIYDRTYFVSSQDSKTWALEGKFEKKNHHKYAFLLAECIRSSEILKNHIYNSVIFILFKDEYYFEIPAAAAKYTGTTELSSLYIPAAGENYPVIEVKLAEAN